MSFQRQETRTSRKVRVCECCGRLIDKGERYLYTVRAEYGDFYAYSLCAQCDATYVYLWKHKGPNGEKDPHYVWDDYRDEGVDPNRLIEILGNEACCIADLRWAVGLRRGWRRPDRTLMPTPEAAA